MNARDVSRQVSFIRLLDRSISDLAPALPTPRIATRVHARDDAHAVISHKEEHRERETPDQSSADIAVNDRKPLRLQADRFKTPIDLFDEPNTEPHAPLFVPRCGVFNVCSGKGLNNEFKTVRHQDSGDPGAGRVGVLEPRTTAILHSDWPCTQ
jgi:hypothetical protein